MSRSLSRGQASLLGLIAITCLGLGAWGMTRMGLREGVWRETFELRVGFPEVHDIDRGTPVRVRGVNAGQVIAVEYPEQDNPSGETVVWLRLELDAAFRDRLYADATASIFNKGLMSSSVIAIHPGSPRAGPLAGDVLRAEVTPELAEVTEKLYSVAQRADALLEEIQKSQGTIARLLKDDSLYHDIKAGVRDSQKLLHGAQGTVAEFREKLEGMEEFMRVGQETVEAMKQDAEAIKRLPIVRSYVEDPVESLVRPDCDRQRQAFDADVVFEPGTAILTDRGRELVWHAANWLKGERRKDSEVAVVAFADPNNSRLSPAYAKTLTQKQCEAVVEFLKDEGVHKTGWIARRKITATGFGVAPSPVPESQDLPPNNVQILLFVPRN